MTTNQLVQPIRPIAIMQMMLCGTLTASDAWRIAYANSRKQTSTANTNVGMSRALVRTQPA
jgi:hypothetical protein